MDTSLWTLFISAFVSSTILPGSSEVFIAYLSSENVYTPSVLISVAGLGNTLGGMSSWLIGRIIASRYSMQDVLNQKHQVAEKQIQRWGSPILLFSWVPILGDPLCMAAGWLRIHWISSLLFIALGKYARYTVIVLAIQ